MSVSRTESVSGTSNGLEHHLLDAVALDLEGPGIDLVAPARVDRQLQRDLALHAQVVDLGDEPGLVALGERAGDLEVDEEVLADRQRGRSSVRRAYRPR